MWGGTSKHMAPIALDEQTERRLDKLRAAVRRQTGHPISRAELLERLVEDAYGSRDEVVDMFRTSQAYVADEDSGTVHRPNGNWFPAGRTDPTNSGAVPAGASLCPLLPPISNGCAHGGTQPLGALTDDDV